MELYGKITIRLSLWELQIDSTGFEKKLSMAAEPLLTSHVKVETHSEDIAHFCGVQLTNRRLLWVSAITFFLFVVAELLGAIISNSLSLLGDAAAMSVDVFSYFCNLYAEHVKEKRGFIDESTRMLLEVYIPTFSVCSLLGVSIYILIDAINVVTQSNPEDDVDVLFLYGFAAANMVVDLVCAILYCVRGSDVMTQKNVHTFSTDEEAPKHITILKDDATASKAGAGGTVAFPPPNSVDVADELRERRTITTTTTTKNLNMISALTHVGGDTLRTSSVLVSAAVSSIFNLNVALCDAWAAIVVTITIFGIVVPLAREIYHAARKHWIVDSANNQTVVISPFVGGQM